MPNLSAALLQAYARSESSTRHLIGVEMLHAFFPGGRLAFVNYDDGISLDSVFHTGMAMEVKEPESGGQPANVVEIRIDGTPGTFQQYINGAVQTGDPVHVNFRPFAYNMTTRSIIDIVGTFPFLVTQADYDMTTCILQLGHVSPTNQKFPNVRYTAESHPGMY